VSSSSSDILRTILPGMPGVSRHEQRAVIAFLAVAMIPSTDFGLNLLLLVFASHVCLPVERHVTLESFWRASCNTIGHHGVHPHSWNLGVVEIASDAFSFVEASDHRQG
jgi:hypothetical protein